MDDSYSIHLQREELKELIKHVVVEVVDELMSERKDNKDGLLNIREASSLLNLAIATLYEKTSQKSIPHYKQGKKIMFKKSELMAWVESAKQKVENRKIDKVKVRGNRIDKFF